MELICDCGKKLKYYDDTTEQGFPIYECDCGKSFILSELKERD